MKDSQVNKVCCSVKEALREKLQAISCLRGAKLIESNEGDLVKVTMGERRWWENRQRASRPSPPSRPFLATQSPHRAHLCPHRRAHLSQVVLLVVHPNLFP